MDHRNTKVFDSDYLAAANLQGRDISVVVDHCQVDVKVGRDGTQKNVLFFRGKKKGLVLNKTNEKAIAAVYGHDDENWIGESLILFATTTEFGGEIVDCIRVRVPPKTSVDRTQPVPQVPPTPEPLPAVYDTPSEADISDVPF